MLLTKNEVLKELLKMDINLSGRPIHLPGKDKQMLISLPIYKARILGLADNEYLTVKRYGNKFKIEKEKIALKNPALYADPYEQALHDNFSKVQQSRIFKDVTLAAHKGYDKSKIAGALAREYRLNDRFAHWLVRHAVQKPLSNPKRKYKNNPRFVSSNQLTELINLYHLARTALSGKDDSKYQRMIWASKEFHKAYPNISSTAAYKDLSDAVNYGMNPKRQHIIFGEKKAKKHHKPEDSVYTYIVDHPDGPLIVGIKYKELKNYKWPIISGPYNSFNEAFKARAYSR